jgi:hypothetical protein
LPQHVRTEFVVLFTWKEPNPSDKLRGMTPSDDADAPATPGKK